MISFSVSIAISFLSLVTRINSSSFAEEYVNNHNDDLFDQVNSNNNDLQEDPSLFDSNINDYDSIFLSSSSSSPSFEDDANTDLLADCLTPDRLGARDAETTKECPANNNLMTIPQLPTLDQLINKAVPVDGTDEEQNLALPSPAVVIPADPQAQNKRICPWYRPFYLCCLCDVAQTTEYCQDCLPSRFIPFVFVLDIFAISTLRLAMKMFFLFVLRRRRSNAPC